MFSFLSSGRSRGSVSWSKQNKKTLLGSFSWNAWKQTCRIIIQCWKLPLVHSLLYAHACQRITLADYLIIVQKLWTLDNDARLQSSHLVFRGLSLKLQITGLVTLPWHQCALVAYDCCVSSHQCYCICLAPFRTGTDSCTGKGLLRAAWRPWLKSMYEVDSWTRPK